VVALGRRKTEARRGLACMLVLAAAGFAIVLTGGGGAAAARTSVVCPPRCSGSYSGRWDAQVNLTSPAGKFTETVAVTWDESYDGTAWRLVEGGGSIDVKYPPNDPTATPCTAVFRPNPRLASNLSTYGPTVSQDGRGRITVAFFPPTYWSGAPSEPEVLKSSDGKNFDCDFTSLKTSFRSGLWTGLKGSACHHVEPSGSEVVSFPDTGGTIQDDCTATPNEAGTTGSASLKSTLKLVTSSQPAPLPASPLPAAPPPEHSTPDEVRARAKGVLVPGVGWALFTCIPAGTGAALFLLPTTPLGQITGAVMVVASAQLCAKLIDILKQATATYDDPPLGGFGRAAAVRRSLRKALALPACTRYGANASFCTRLESALDNLSNALGSLEASAGALATTIGRETAAAKAGDKQALALQQANARNLLPGFTTQLAAVSSDGLKLSQVLGSAGLTGSLSRPLYTAAVANIRAMLTKARVGVRDLTLLLASYARYESLNAVRALRVPLG
jgi:hypothetical protein